MFLYSQLINLILPRPTAYDVFAMEIRTRAAWAALGCLGSIKPAKQHVEKLTAADAAEGHALVTLVNAEVVGRNGSKQLQCLPTSNVEITLPSEEHVPLNLAGIEKAKMIVEHYLPLTSHVPPLSGGFNGD